VPCIDYEIIIDGASAGTLMVRLTDDFEKIAEEGNAGIELNRAFHNQNLVVDMTRLVYPLFKKHGISKLLVTFEEGKGAIKRACEELGGKPLDVITTADGGKKGRYVIAI